MGKKPQQHCWPEAMRLCRLNGNDVEMAKRLGFRPDAFIRAKPSPKHKWKLPVKAWVRGRYRERFGQVLGKTQLPAPAPVEVELDQEDKRRFEEQLYWEDYWARNEDDTRPKKHKAARRSRRRAWHRRRVVAAPRHRRGLRSVARGTRTQQTRGTQPSPPSPSFV